MKTFLSFSILLLLVKVLKSDVYHPKSSSYYPKYENSITDMKTHIKNVLNMKTENSTLDNYVANYFRVDNPNPTYVFVLPDENNRTIVMRRSDFLEAIFPNITTINKFQNIYNKTTLSTSINGNNNQYNNQHDKAKSELFSNLKTEKLIQDYPDYDEDESLRIVAENVRTERNFIKKLEEINEGLESFTRNPKSINSNNQNSNLNNQKSQQQLKTIKNGHLDNTNSGSRKNIRLTKPDNEKEDWDSLGLGGWTGDLRLVDDDAKYNENEKFIPTFLTSSEIEEETIYQEPGQAQLNRPRTPKHYSQSTDNIHKTTKNKYSNSQGNFNNEQISEKLNSLLTIENQQYINDTGHDRRIRPKFPVTSSRASHKDEDIFIARANNPFGHSTKWKLSNSSKLSPDESEGRIKRGVFQLYSMVKCATGCDPLSYKGYGCYCGFLGSGRALDGIDRCCQNHDNCYSASSCPMFLEYFVPYLWKCYRGKPLCAINHGEWGGRNSCASRLCECDKILSKCLRRFYCPRKRNVCTSSPFRLLQNFVMDF